MTSLDIFTFIKNESNTYQDLVSETNELITLSNNSRLAKELNRHLEEYCDDKGICLHCGEEIIYTKDNENRGEYFGFNCTEVIHNKYCPNCG